MSELYFIFIQQRNPGAIRQPEEDKGKEFYEMDLNVELDKSSIISPHLPKLCNDALNTTFAREIDLRFWANSKGNQNKHRIYCFSYPTKIDKKIIKRVNIVLSLEHCFSAIIEFLLYLF